jgi:hypothetical protein
VTVNTRMRINPASLSAQIKDAEQQVLNRKRKIGVGTTTLVRKMQQQMIAPTTFLFAAGIGFLLGEITKRKPSKTHATTNQSHTVETSPLKTALSLVTSIQTLYTALPIAWMINTINRRGTSNPALEQPVHRTMTDSGSSDSI